MLNILNMVKTGIIGNLYEFRFDFEFDEASTLPVNFIVMEQKRYLIAEGSTAKNVSTNTYYTYNGVGKKWVKTLSKTPMPAPTTDTNITENGNYSVVNNDTTGYNDVTVNVFSEPVVLINKDITINGNYNASSDNADGYSTVNVNVLNTYTVNDNGKVVTNQELVAQTAYPTTITENDTYDTTNYNSITVNVSGGGGGNATLTTTGTEFNYISDYLTLLESINIPSNIESIGYGCFQDCTGLKSVTIPNSVTYIWGSAFEDCTALENMTFEPTTPPELGGDLGLPTTCVIRVPQGTLSKYTSASNYPDPSQYIYEEY